MDCVHEQKLFYHHRSRLFLGQKAISIILKKELVNVAYEPNSRDNISLMYLAIHLSALNIVGVVKFFCKDHTL